MGSRFTVLLVEENQELCRRLQQVIAAAGYRAECLKASEATLGAIQGQAPDALVIDIGPAEGGGMTLLRRLLTNRATRQIPIIVTSRQAALEYELLDAFDFLVDPIDEKRLLEDLALLAANRNAQARGAAPPLQGAELPLFQEYLHQHSGLHFDRRNLKVLERGLLRRMRALGLERYPDYYAYLEKFAESRRELTKLLGLLTIGETYFFRYLPHFEALICSVIPAAIARNRQSRTLRIWSAGCSTGEEPYSLALVLARHFPQLADWDVQILATDINKQAMKKARDGLFGARSVRLVDPYYLKKYFRPVGRLFQLDAGIRERVRFAYFNLQTGSYPSPDPGTAGVDMIFCRNVMIYFRPETTRTIVERFSRCLRPGGHLFLGHAETLLNVSERFARVAAAGGFFYRLEPELSEPRPAPVRPAPPATPAEPAPDRLAGPNPAEPHPPRSWSVAAPASPPRPQELYGRAMEAFDREEFQTAAALFERLLKVSPRHVGGLLGKGFVLANQGRYDEALDYCRRVLSEDDLCPAAYFLRGMLLETRQEWQGAAEEYRKALLLDMDFVMPHYNLSRLYARLGRLRDARRELRNSLGILEKAPDEALIPCSGGLSKEVFLEVCREDLQRFDRREHDADVFP